MKNISCLFSIITLSNEYLYNIVRWYDQWPSQILFDGPQLFPNCSNQRHCFYCSHHNSIYKIDLISCRTDMNMYNVQCAMCCGHWPGRSVHHSTIIIKNRNYAKCETFQKLTVLWMNRMWRIIDAVIWYEIAIAL